MKLSLLRVFVFTLLSLSIFTATDVRAQGKLFTVNDVADTDDQTVGDGICADVNGKCTIRAAIQEAGNDNYLDGINFSLPTPSTINLTLGELTVMSNVYIVGPGARNLTVQRSTAASTPDFRVFNFENAGSLLRLQGLKIRNGSVPQGDGGGIYVGSSNIITLSDLVITNNSANRGGGIANFGLLTIKRSLVSSNSAATNQGIIGVGGGLFNPEPYASADIINSTFTGNNAVEGGSIYNSRQMFFINATISRNSAGSSGCSVVNAANGTATFLNTIVGMDNSAVISSLSGSFNSLGNNLITDARNSTGFTNGVNNDQVSNSNTVNPLLGNLANNGGQTDTLALLAGSPAIDRGNNCAYYGNCPQPLPQRFNLTTDQRLTYLRLGGATVDVGAYENQAPTIGGSISVVGIGFRNRAGGTLLILTSANTNEKQTRITNPFGNFRFNNLSFGDVYFLERRPKRFGEAIYLGVFEFDNLPVPPQTISKFEREGIRIEVEK